MKDEQKEWRILTRDPWLRPFSEAIDRRMQALADTRRRLLPHRQSLTAFATGHLYYGFHRTRTGWV